MLVNIPNKLRKKTLRERIYEEVARMIVSGELPSDELIKEKHLSRKLQVSRTPFREAIGTLAKEGLVEIKPYCGFYVRSFSRKEAEDLYELKKRLECFAVELAVPQMSDGDICRFGYILGEATAALNRGDMKTYAARDEEFSRTIAEQSGNGPLIDTLARLALQIQLCGTVANRGRQFAERAANGHDDILQAFKARDIPRAAFLVRVHIGHVQEAVLDCFPKEIAGSRKGRQRG